MKFEPRSMLTDSLRDFQRTWPQLILADLLMRVVAVVVFTPAVGLLLKVFLASTASGVVTDAGIVSFLFHPIGLAALLIVGAVSLGLLFAETGVLMVIGFGAIEERRVTWLEAARYAFNRVVGLVRIAWFAVVRLLPISLPFFATVGFLYWLLLRKYDINYYLTQKPPEFQAVVLAAGVLLTVMAVLIIIRIAGWLLALPMVLFEATGGKKALRASEEVTATHRRKLALWLGGWIVAVGLLSALATFGVGLLGDALIPRDSLNIALLLTGLCAVIVVGGLANLGVQVFATTLFPLFVVRLYRSLAGPGELKPEIAPRGSLGKKASKRIPAQSILWASAAALVVVAVGAYLAMRNLDGGDHAQIIAHRGGAGVAPENTMAAFKRGIADGADWLELDVQENADGVVVLGHDRDYMRVAGADIEVWRAKDADLADLDVGSFFGPQFAGERVPTLRKVLELVKGQAGVFIELKHYGHDQNLEQKIVDLVEATGMGSNIVIMSLEYESIRKTAAIRPAWTYGLLSAVALGDLTRLNVGFLALTADAASFSMIHRAHKREMKVYAWTIDDPVQMSVMMSRGIDGIITDQVARAHQVKEFRAKLTPFGRLVVWIAGEMGILHGMEKSSAREDA
jgi:glycerophosphoryl diester phosphodiesterase